MIFVRTLIVDLRLKLDLRVALNVFVQNPTDTQEQTSGQGREWLEVFRKWWHWFKWTPAIILTREPWNYDHTSPIQTVNWLREKIEEAELSVTDLLQESRESNGRSTFRPMIDLGIWNPGILSESKSLLLLLRRLSTNQPETVVEILSQPPTTVQPAPVPSAGPLVSQSSSPKIVCSDRFTQVPFSSSRPDRKKLACGEEISIVSQSGQWTRVKTKDGMEGNVATRFVDK